MTNSSLCDKFSGMLGGKMLTQGYKKVFLSLNKAISPPTGFREPF